MTLETVQELLTRADAPTAILQAYEADIRQIREELTSNPANEASQAFYNSITGASSPSLTKEQIESLSEDQINANWDIIKASLAKLS